MLPPINLRRASRRRSSLSREMPLLETDSEVDTSDFTNIDPPTAPAAPAVAREGGLKVRMLAAPQSRIPTIASRNRGQSNASQRSRGSVGSHHQNTEDEDDGRASTVALTASVSTSSFRSAATATNAHCQMDNLLPHSPPTARQPRAAPTRAPTVSNVAAASGKSSAKRSLWSRLRAPLSGLVDKSPIKPSVRERIAAFNSMDHESAESSYSAVVRSQSLGNPYAFTRSHSKRSSQITPAGTRAESHTGGSTRTASPALSNTSMVSARVQEAINMFTGQTPDKDTGNGQPSRRRTSTSGGVKRAKPVDPNDDFVSPTKRQRARTQGDNYMASASGKSDRSLTASSGSGRLSHVTLVQHMAQHYPHQ
ncbi:hypothetical protein FBU59_001929 [Linderina macrospora]|uniref:Uncharacterized protein n=1 Tax=Linderina macrospora TaxID=4868 RepID=A0ACC1JCT7_9FUNG|nr:hypothetical protein FBU59_001929 [Linderina macrospora]